MGEVNSITECQNGNIKGRKLSSKISMDDQITERYSRRREREREREREDG